DMGSPQGIEDGLRVLGVDDDVTRIVLDEKVIRLRNALRMSGSPLVANVFRFREENIVLELVERGNFREAPPSIAVSLALRVFGVIQIARLDDFVICNVDQLDEWEFGRRSYCSVSQEPKERSL